MKIKRFLLGLSLACLASTYSQAQVKVGKTPGTIGSNEYLEVQADNDSKVIVTKDKGFVGINTTTPVDQLTVKGTVNAVGFATRAGSSPALSSSTNVFNVEWNGTDSNLWIDGNNKGGIVTYTNSLVRPAGFMTKAGSLGAETQNLFNVSWNNSQADLWVDGNDLGGLVTYTNSLVRPAGFMTKAGSLGAETQNWFNISWNNSQADLWIDGSDKGGLVTYTNSLVRPAGFGTKAGSLGAETQNLFNVSWNNSQAHLWIDGNDLGNITTTSDYRLKKNVSNMSTSALSRIAKLRPVLFEYKEGDTRIHEGFIAHELKSVIPSAVNGEKDALTKDGKIQPQTLNPFPVISVLTKAVQEQQTQIEQLKKENAVLKSFAMRAEAADKAYAQLAKQVKDMQGLLGINAKAKTATKGVALK